MEFDSGVPGSGQGVEAWRVQKKIFVTGDEIGAVAIFNNLSDVLAWWIGDWEYADIVCSVASASESAVNPSPATSQWRVLQLSYGDGASLCLPHALSRSARNRRRLRLTYPDSATAWLQSSSRASRQPAAESLARTASTVESKFVIDPLCQPGPQLDNASRQRTR